MQSTGNTATVPRRGKARSLVDITRELDALRARTSRELAKTYEELFGVPTRSNNRQYLLRQIAWRLQDDAGHFDAIRRRVDKLVPSVELPVRWQQRAAREAGLPIVAPAAASAGTSTAPPRDPRLPPAGTVLEREHGGRVHRVVVLDDGFELDGARFSTLTEVAKAITGAKWNGYEFFKRALSAARARSAP